MPTYTIFHKKTVLNYISLFNKHWLSWRISYEFANDQVVAEKLELKKSMPISLDFEIISNKLQQRGVTLKYLYNKLFEEKKITFSYQYFQKLYKMWSNKQPSYMIQDYKWGDQLLIDYRGDPDTCNMRKAELLVFILGALKLMFVYDSWSQTNTRIFIRKSSSI